MWRNFYARFAPKNTAVRALSVETRRRQRRKRLLIGLGVIVGGVAWWKTVTYIKKKMEPAFEGEKEKIVIVGSGFSSLGMLDNIDTRKFDVTVISPTSYFLFTPLLAEATVGTVAFDSIVEPVRKYGERNEKEFNYFEAVCQDVFVKEKKIICKPINHASPDFEVPYDHLVVAVGRWNNENDIPGVKQNANFLTTLGDAHRIRNRILDSLESMNLPNITEEEKIKKLHFIVVGGGPIARQTAMQINEFLHEKTKAEFKELRDYTKVSIINMKDHINNHYDSIISSYVSKKSRRTDVNVINDRVKELKNDSIVLLTPENEYKTIHFGACIWSTGTKALPITQRLGEKFKEQYNAIALVVDSRLRLLGDNNIYALGDCATIDQRTLIDKCEKTFLKSDQNKDGYIDMGEFKTLCEYLGQKYPGLLHLKEYAEDVFNQYNKDKDLGLDMEEFRSALMMLNNKITRFPSSASTALQQGQFLGQYFNNGEHKKPEEEKSMVFKYKHFGGYEYIGAEGGLVPRGSKGGAIMSGPGAWWLWNNIYFSSVFGLRMILQTSTSYLFSRLFGHSTSRI